MIAAMTGWARVSEDWNAGPDWERLDFGPVEPVPALELGDEERGLLGGPGP